METTPGTTCLVFGQATPSYHRKVFNIFVVVGNEVSGLNEHLNRSYP